MIGSPAFFALFSIIWLIEIVVAERFTSLEPIVVVALGAVALFAAYMLSPRLEALVPKHVPEYGNLWGRYPGSRMDDAVAYKMGGAFRLATISLGLIIVIMLSVLVVIYVSTGTLELSWDWIWKGV